MPLAAVRYSWRVLLVSSFFVVLSLLEGCVADSFTGANAFFWGFNDTTITTTIKQCAQLTAFITTNSSNGGLGTAPYYMMAFKVNGIPTVSSIGTNPFDLTWQVNQETGSVLILTVADANGNAGGVPANTFSVIDGDSSCLSSSSTDLKITSNVSTSDILQTCQPLGLQVTGGTKPYTISIAGLNSAVITNVTMGPNDDLLTYINRADPGTQLVVSVSDKDGWGTSTSIINTAGTSDVSCNGLESTTSNSGGSGTTSAVPNTATSSSAPVVNSGSTSHTTIIAGAAAAVGVAAALLGVAAFMWYRRRQRRRQINRPEHPGFVLDAWAAPSPYTHNDTMNVSNRGVSTIETSTNVETVFVPDYGYKKTPSDADINAPLLSAGAMRDSFARSSSFVGLKDPNQKDPNQKDPNRRDSMATSNTGSASRIIQHQDANDIVELPPPYIDRGAAEAASAPLRVANPSRSSMIEPSESGPSSSSSPGPSASMSRPSFPRDEKAMLRDMDEKKPF